MVAEALVPRNCNMSRPLLASRNYDAGTFGVDRGRVARAGDAARVGRWVRAGRWARAERWARPEGIWRHRIPHHYHFAGIPAYTELAS